MKAIKEILKIIRNKWVQGKYQEDIDISKKDNGDFVTSIDTQIENDVLNEINKYNPNSSIISEESENIDGNDTCFYIDPIDGTMNMINGLPEFCFGMAFEKNNKLVSSGMYFPAFDLKIYCNGENVYLNGVKEERYYNIFNTIDRQYEKDSNLKNKVFGIDVFNYTYDELKKIRDAVDEENIVRQPMCIIYSMLMVYFNSFDAGVYWGVNSWDIAPGYLLINNFGGEVTDLNRNKKWGDLKSTKEPIFCSKSSEINNKLIEIYNKK